MELSDRKIFMVRLAAHELNRALRVWARTVPATEILGSILRERERALSGVL